MDPKPGEPGINIAGLTMLLQFVVSFGYILVVTSTRRRAQDSHHAVMNLFFQH